LYATDSRGGQTEKEMKKTEHEIAALLVKEYKEK
jgi:hypothetical protein